MGKELLIVYYQMGHFHYNIAQNCRTLFAPIISFFAAWRGGARAISLRRSAAAGQQYHDRAPRRSAKHPYHDGGLNFSEPAGKHPKVASKRPNVGSKSKVAGKHPKAASKHPFSAITAKYLFSELNACRK